MTHDEAKKSMAAEAYILDDLEAAERNAFEEHFFDCTDCTADVLDAARIADGIRTGTNVVPFRHYSRWAAAAVAAAVAIGLAYNYMPQVATNWRHPSAPIGRAARVSTPEQVIQLEDTRAPQSRHPIRGDQSVALDFTIPPQDVPPTSFTCEVRDTAGVRVAVRTVSQRDANEAVRINLPPHALHSGEYNLVIRGGDREIPGYHFTVEVQ
ncbi:MAG: zf-HC2 domain-containing protein [Acidobacteria bacterium]|nr:zf-HC2 domain-containing protein [Acidobacteriota bacterium]MBV9188741.1 zf-HC2 domain-containing protein [Acidobacteriota bacterium]